MALMTAGAQAWAKGLETWGKMLGPRSGREGRRPRTAASPRPNGSDNPIFDTIRQTYLRLSDKLLGTVEEIDGLDEEARQKLRFAITQLRRRDEPVQLRADQPAGAQADDRDRAARICSRASPTCSTTLRRAS